MTASKTPNLGLMSPVGSDPFVVTDFATTFGIVDQNPGILVVPNQASRPTGWNASQHGRHIWQADQNIEWVWNQPSPTPAGTWQRTWPKGLLGHSANASAINTTQTQTANAPVVNTVSCMIPGGRQVRFDYNFFLIANDTAGQVIVDITDGSGNLLMTRTHDGYSYGARKQVGPFSQAFWGIHNPAPTTQVNMTYQMRFRSPDPNVIGPPWSGGSSQITGPELAIYEI